MRSSPVTRSLFTIILIIVSVGICRAEPRLSCSIGGILPEQRTLRVACTIDGAVPGRMAVRFRHRYAGIDGLSDRVYGIRAVSGGSRLQLEIRGDGLYLVDLPNPAPSVELTWELRLTKVFDPSQYSLVSTLGPQAGIFHAADIAPTICADPDARCRETPLRLRVDPPEGWRSYAASAGDLNGYDIPEPSRAMILVGPFREREFAVGAMRVRALVSGKWSFTDDEILGLAETIAADQAAMIDGKGEGAHIVAIAPFPLPLTGLRSSGICTGNSAVLMLNEGGSPDQSLGLLRRHLGHEMFHYYLPNAFNVRENFDWFWEGFTRYAAWLTLTRRGLLDLQGYLDSIGAEYEACYHNPLINHVSLISASADKFANQSMTELVYRKGTLVAALCDLEIRRQSKGSRSLVDALRNVYREYALTRRPIGNTEVIAELARLGDLATLIRDDIQGTREIDLAERVKNYGLFLEWSRATGGRARITVAPKASAEKRRIIEGIAGGR